MPNPEQQFTQGENEEPVVAPAQEPTPKPEKEKKSKFPPDLEPYVSRVEEFIKLNKRHLDEIAGDTSLKYKPANGFYIDYESGEIGLDVSHWKQAEEQGESLEQIFWATMHEIGHFRDLKDDPQGVKKKFKEIDKKAKALAPKVAAIWEQKHGSPLPDYLTQQIPIDPKNPAKTMSYIEIFIRKAFARFINCLDDIHDNRSIGSFNASYGTYGRNVEEVKRLYRDFLFPTDGKKIGQPPQELEPVDYQGSLLSSQFGNYLLRKKMVPDQSILVDDQVKQALDDRISGRRTIVEEADIITRPSGARDKIQHNASYREEAIRNYIEPIFEELFLLDVENQPLPPPPPPPSKGGEGEEGEGDGTPVPGEGQPQPQDQPGEPGEEPESGSGEGNPWKDVIEHKDPIDEKAVNKFIKDQEKKKKVEEEAKKEKEEEAKLTPEERARRAVEIGDRKFCEKHDIDPRVASEYRKIESSIEQFKPALAEVFKQMLTTIQEQIVRVWETGYRSGKFNVEYFINKYSHYLIEGAQDFLPFEELDTYDRQEFIRSFKLFPDRLVVRLILDGSGSMVEERILALKQIVVLILEALDSAEADINNGLKAILLNLEDKKIQIDTEIIMFGSKDNSRVVKPLNLSVGNDLEQRRVNKLKGYSQIHSGYGGTCDAEPWYQLDKEFQDEKYLDDIRNGKAKEIVVEVTDGGSNNSYSAGVDSVEDTKNAIGIIEDKSILVHGFQIGTPDESELKSFQEIWNEGRQEPKGDHIDHIAKLVPAFTKFLTEALENIDLQVVQESQ